MGNDSSTQAPQEGDLRLTLRKPSSVEEFNTDVSRLNALASAVKDKSGRKFQFTVRDYSPVLWRQSVSVEVALKLPDDSRASQSKILDFKQFYKFYHRMIQYLDSATTADASATAQPSPLLARKTLSKKAEDDEDAECPLCLDRAAEVALAECNHAFCNKCLDEWTKRNPTCPMCRQQTSEDSEPWILTSEPESEEIFDHLLDFLDSISTAS
eukprot:TRINITY_DN3270_c0_g1_i2.p1 TRINITY_DN3270_c0_g1~~TRINITY_DN3270_c0_g1_i2.p1  ORF type:complete len:212 (+),score=26.28 TRINITY_DN3270_c0_g1_i2:129-764(+)